MGTTRRVRNGPPSTHRVRLKGILIADRDEPWALALREALADRGYSVRVEKEAGRAGWRLHEPFYDLVILSTSLGDGELERLMKSARDRRPEPLVILVVDLLDQEPSEAWRFLRAATVLRRPCKIHDVVDAAAALLGPPIADIERTA